MFELRHRRSQILLQLLLTLLVVPFVFPLVAMIQGSLAGSGWGNYHTVLSLDELPRFFVNSANGNLMVRATAISLTGINLNAKIDCSPYLATT